MVLGLKPVGKLVTSKKNLSVRQNQGLAWSSDSNLWGKLVTSKNNLIVISKKNLSVRQNQGLAWSSDSNLWGN